MDLMSVSKTSLSPYSQFLQRFPEDFLEDFD